MADWIYFATSRKASLASTVGAVLSTNFLWRSALNENHALIANVRHIKPGDYIVLAWRHPGGVKKAYLRCRVASASLPVMPGLVIDKLAGPDANSLVSVGYPESPDGTVEGIRVDDVIECFFEPKGTYGGINSLHSLAAVDAAQIQTATQIPPDALTQPTRNGKRVSLRKPKLMPASTQSVPHNGTDTLEITATVDSRAFDAYLFVDWSSNSRPVTGADSIWVASGTWSGGIFRAGPPRNVATRAECANTLRTQALVWRDEGKRVLVGFDFAFGYPAGFCRALGLTSSGAPWRAVHSHFASHVLDSLQNEHNRDEFADACNRKVGAPGPFWGCCASAATASLTQQRVGVFQFPHHGLEEWRATDREAGLQVTTQSVWKLNCGVSVGGQTILGIKHLEELARSVGGHRWPFEGWTTPTKPAIWFAEIFPTLVQYPEWADEYVTRRDRTQVQSCLRRAAERDAAGLLAGDFAKPIRLDAATLARVEGEEGWILWV